MLLNLLSFSIANTQANEPKPFSNENLQLKAWIDPDADAVVSQQINLYIELATQRWFTGGTRIGSIEIDNAVVLRREKFAVNSTRIQNQQTWTVQLWTLTLYPQSAGDYIVPDITLEVSVADENGEPEARQLVTKALMFNAVTPDQVLDESVLDGQSSWVASTRLEVIESYDKASTELKVGDSLKRTIEFRSENVAAMMLPVLQFDSVAGLATYQDPSKIEDKVNRGTYLASRTEVITYVIEEAGFYTLPQLELFWWDLTSQSLQREILAERIISTIGLSDSVTVQDIKSKTSTEPPVAMNFRKVSVLGIAVLIGFLGFWWFRHRPNKRSLPNIDEVSVSSLEQEYIEQCRAGNYSDAGDLLYQWLNRQLETLDQQTKKLKLNDNSIRRWLCSMNAEHALAIFDQLMKLAHGQAINQGENQNRDLLGLETLPREVKKILATISQESSDDKSEFRLN